MENLSQKQTHRKISLTFKKILLDDDGDEINFGKKNI